jgi:serine/threonine-protein kinase
MAPELTSDEPLDGRTDLYGLGCVGYYLLTGALVFEGQTAMQLVLRHLQAAPVPPSERVGAAVPPGLERLILECLAKAPAARPAGAPALMEALSRCDAGEWTQAEARDWWESHDLGDGASEPIGPTPQEFLVLVPEPAAQANSRTSASP